MFFLHFFYCPFYSLCMKVHNVRFSVKNIYITMIIIVWLYIECQQCVVQIQSLLFMTQDLKLKRYICYSSLFSFFCVNRQMSQLTINADKTQIDEKKVDKKTWSISFEFQARIFYGTFIHVQAIFLSSSAQGRQKWSLITELTVSRPYTAGIMKTVPSFLHSFNEHCLYLSQITQVAEGTVFRKHTFCL